MWCENLNGRYTGLRPGPIAFRLCESMAVSVNKECLLINTYVWIVLYCRFYLWFIYTSRNILTITKKKNLSQRIFFPFLSCGQKKITARRKIKDPIVQYTKHFFFQGNKTLFKYVIYLLQKFLRVRTTRNNFSLVLSIRGKTVSRRRYHVDSDPVIQPQCIRSSRQEHLHNFLYTHTESERERER